MKYRINTYSNYYIAQYKPKWFPFWFDIKVPFKFISGLTSYLDTEKDALTACEDHKAGVRHKKIQYKPEFPKYLDI